MELGVAVVMGETALVVAAVGKLYRWMELVVAVQWGWRRRLWLRRLWVSQIVSQIDRQIELVVAVGMGETALVVAAVGKLDSQMELVVAVGMAETALVVAAVGKLDKQIDGAGCRSGDGGDGSGCGGCGEVTGHTYRKNQILC